jgi:hypothetical protein
VDHDAAPQPQAVAATAEDLGEKSGGEWGAVLIQGVITLIEDFSARVAQRQIILPQPRLLLNDQSPVALLGKNPRGDRASETAADDDRVVMIAGH